MRLSEYATMALAMVEQRGTVKYRVLACCYGVAALRELLRSGLVEATGRGPHRQYHANPIRRRKKVARDS